MELVNKILLIFLLSTNVYSKTLVDNVLEDNFIKYKNIVIKYNNKDYNNIKWKSLLHYNGKKSIIEDENFFITKNNNLKEEFAATIKSFLIDDNLNENHSICKYPARFNYILKQLKLNRNIFPNPNCKEFKKYIENLSAKKIYISYASEQITSIASMMGHMFIKIVGNNNRENALSYYAIMEDNFSFYLKSLFTSSIGYYILTPYKNKLEEYNDIDKRNIWNYELDLSEEEIKDFIYHIWELKSIKVPYNFINHNCGTATIFLLSNINEKFYKLNKKPWQTPLDILKNIYNNDLIKNIELSPSDSYKIKMIQDNFTIEEAINIKKFIKTENVNYIKNQESFVVADYLSGDLVLRNKINVNKYNNIQNIIYNNFKGWEYINLKQKVKNPLESQYSSAIKLSYENYKKYNVISLTFYPVYKEIYDNNSQYFNDFELNFLKTKINYNLSTNKININYIDLINIKSLNPSGILLPTLSFKLNLGYRELYELSENNGNIDFNFGIGKAYNLIKDILNIYFLPSIRYFDKLYFEQELGFSLKLFNFSNTILSFYLPVKNNLDYKNYLKLNQSFYFNDKFSFNIEYEYVNMKENYSNFSINFKYFF